jgi:hypothetical protein
MRYLGRASGMMRGLVGGRRTNTDDRHSDERAGVFVHRDPRGGVILTLPLQLAQPSRRTCTRGYSPASSAPRDFSGGTYLRSHGFSEPPSRRALRNQMPHTHSSRTAASTKRSGHPTPQTPLPGFTWTCGRPIYRQVKSLRETESSFHRTIR